MKNARSLFEGNKKLKNSRTTNIAAVLRAALQVVLLSLYLFYKHLIKHVIT